MLLFSFNSSLLYPKRDSSQSESNKTRLQIMNWTTTVHTEKCKNGQEIVFDPCIQRQVFSCLTLNFSPERKKFVIIKAQSC